MKSLICGFYILVLFSLSGCSKIVYTQQLVNDLHTKQDLVKQLGQPDQKITYPDFEEWVYIRDTLSVLSNKNNSDTIKKEISPSSPDSLKNIFYSVHHTSIKFHIDSTNRIIGYKNNGVDLTRKVKESFGNSVLNILGGTLVVLLIIGFEIAKDKLDL
jgi:hypothetical protein